MEPELPLQPAARRFPLVYGLPLLLHEKAVNDRTGGDRDRDTDLAVGLDGMRALDGGYSQTLEPYRKCPGHES